MNTKLTLLLLLLALGSTATVAAQVVSPPPSQPASPKPESDGEGATRTFQGLQSVDGKKVSLAEYQQNYVVICFTSNTCPYSVDYEDRLKQLQQKFDQENWSAVVVAINSNDHKDDSLEEMKERAQQQKFNFDYLKDQDQTVAAAFEAVYTPEFFVLDRQRKVVYQGALDDSTKTDKVKINYVLKAIESHQKGDVIEIAKTGARGCRIRFQRRRPKK